MLAAAIVLAAARPGGADTNAERSAPPDPVVANGPAIPVAIALEASVLAPVGSLSGVVDDDPRAPETSETTAAPLIPVTVLEPVQTLGTNERGQ